MPSLVIYKNSVFEQPSESNTDTISFAELKTWKRKGRFFLRLFSYDSVELRCYRLELLRWPFYHGLIIWLLSRKYAVIRDETNQSVRVTLFCLLVWGIRKLRDWVAKPFFLKRVKKQVALIENDRSDKDSISLNLSAVPVYLRTDLIFGIRSGGSLGHIAGVLNNLNGYCGKPIFLTTDHIPGIRKEVVMKLIQPGQQFIDFSELMELNFNKYFLQEAKEFLNDIDIAFVYQRYTYNNYAGFTLAKLHRVPFVIEYNGSDVWINRHWGNPLKYDSISERIELLNLRVADVIVVVSRPLKNELVSRGIDSDKILVNPNGVDVDSYTPDVDGNIVRARYSFTNKIVIAFIGTFGKWHGVEVLTEAFGRLLKKYPEYCERVRLLLIGDGMTMPQVKDIIKNYAMTDICSLTGLIPQERGSQYLAAGDILVSPHVPNPDGTPFFGSPTKLFEYMAMGKGIIASNLDQIGEVLEHDRTGWLVKPGDIHELMQGMKILIDNPELRERLGKTAREEAVANHTWKEHTRKIIKKLQDRCER